MFGIDTNAVIHAISGRVPRVRERMEQALAGGTPIGLSTIVLYELNYGIRKSARPGANSAALLTFLSLGFEVWTFEPADAEEAGEIRAALEKSGTPIGPYDILVAAQARRRGAILVTANASEFARVPGLKTDDWSKAQ